MKTRVLRLLTVACFLLPALSSPAATLYVDLNSPGPAAPYSTWATAATNIQDAVDASSLGDLVLVTNGVYQAGGRAVSPDLLTNRVAVTVPITIQSLNGPASTVIQGYQIPGATNGDSAVRCVYLTDGATLTGFSLVGGATRVFTIQNIGNDFVGGGVWCASTNALITNCVVSNNAAAYGGGGVYSGTMYNCSIASNSVDFAFNGFGGGAYGSTAVSCLLAGNRVPVAGSAYECTLVNCILSNNLCTGAYNSTLMSCTLTGNQGGSGGGANASVLNNCILTSNISIGGAAVGGGGAYSSTLTNCTLIGNSGDRGGGANGGTLVDCLIISNFSLGVNPGVGGGGAYGATLDGCLIFGNSSIVNSSAPLGGGALNCLLNNCTVVSNSGAYGGGTAGCTNNNCIIMFNSAFHIMSNNFSGGVVNFCDTTPLPAAGIYNITNAPLFVDPINSNFRLQSNSPCINSGNNAYVVGAADLDGNPRISGGRVDMGAYEFQNPASIISYAWLQQYGLPTDGSADFVDSDHNGMNNWQKWVAGLNPTNAASVLQVLSPVPSETNLVVTWQSVTNINYFLQRSSSLAPGSFQPLATNIPGQAGTTSYTDTNAPAPGPWFYRVGVP